MGIHRSFAHGCNCTRSGVCLVDKDTRDESPHFLLEGIHRRFSDADRHSECRSSSFGPPPPSFGLRDSDSSPVPEGSRFPCLHLDTGLRHFSPLLNGFCTRAPFFFDTRCNSCLSLLAGRRAAALGLRAPCIRRTASSVGLLATSFGGPHIISRAS
jgi:hypothetical protein